MAEVVFIGPGKTIVELFGDYWHRGEDTKHKILFYQELGYNCLVIWESEFKDEGSVVDRVNKHIGRAI